ncbi:Annexin, partial [Oesophagostomum dentatum]
RLLITLCDCNRDETEATDQINAAQDAFKLYNARRFRFGLENCFIEILTKRNFKQLALIFDEYEKIAHQSLEAAIKQDFSGSFRDSLLSIASITRNKPAHFATLLHKCLK